MERGLTYRFGDVWHVAAAPERVAEVLVAIDEYPRWWPEVVAVSRTGPDTGRVLIRSRLPYALDLSLTAASRTLPNLLVRMDGDLTGWIRFDVRGDDACSVIRYTQEVSVHGLLAAATPLLRSPLRWNHARMMASGRRGLETLLG